MSINCVIGDDAPIGDLALRLVTTDDATGERIVRRLSDLDSARAPSGLVLVASRGERPIAARGLSDDTVVADPFEHTADAVRVLELRAAQLRGGGVRAGRRRLRSLFGRVAGGAARAAAR